ncbi:MAG: EamA family transporter, partial [Promethearchaeota archaeon]
MSNSKEYNKIATSTIKEKIIGMFYVIIVLIGGGLQPIINNARPPDLAPLLFTFMTVLVEFVAITPIILIEQKLKHETPWLLAGPLKAWKKLGIRFIAIGSIFAFATLFVIVGYSMTDSISGAVAVKTQPISMLLIGALILKERVTKLDLICIAIMLVSIFHMATLGTWQINKINLGFIVLLIAPIMWNVGHSMSKKFLEQATISSPQLVFIRTGISSIILGILYIITNGGSTAWQIANPKYLLFMSLMGLNYLVQHYFLYKAMQRIELTF